MSEQTDAVGDDEGSPSTSSNGGTTSRSSSGPWSSCCGRASGRTEISSGTEKCTSAATTRGTTSARRAISSKTGRVPSPSTSGPDSRSAGLPGSSVPSGITSWRSASGSPARSWAALKKSCSSWPHRRCARRGPDLPHRAPVRRSVRRARSGRGPRASSGDILQL